MYVSKINLEKENKIFSSISLRKDLRISNFYNPSPIDVFLMAERTNPDGSVSHRVTSDIYMLFNQQRLDRASREALIQHFNDLQIKEPSFYALRSKLTDDQLISLVKSRYLQTPSELLAWSRYLNTLGDQELRAISDRLKPDDPSNVEPSNPTDPAPAPAPVSE